MNEEWKEFGLKLGINIRDSCGSETRALDESLQFVVDRVPICKMNDTVPLFGVVGASMSLLTAAVANLLRLFQIPLVSFLNILQTFNLKYYYIFHVGEMLKRAFSFFFSPCSLL